MISKTTIAVGQDTKQCLDELKVGAWEPYDNVLRRMLKQILDSCEEGVDEKTRKVIEQGIRDVKGGKVVSTTQLKRLLFRSDKYEIREGMGRQNQA